MVTATASPVRWSEAAQNGDVWADAREHRVGVPRSHNAARMLDNRADPYGRQPPNVTSNHANHGMTMRLADARYSA